MITKCNLWFFELIAFIRVKLNNVLTASFKWAIIIVLKKNRYRLHYSSLQTMRIRTALCEKIANMGHEFSPRALTLAYAFQKTVRLTIVLLGTVINHTYTR